MKQLHNTSQSSVFDKETVQEESVVVENGATVCIVYEDSIFATERE